MTATPAAEPSNPLDEGDLRWMGIVWLSVSLSTFALAALVAYEPGFDDAPAVVLTVIPLVVVLALTVVFVRPFLDVGEPLRALATAAAIGGWSVIMFDDDRWSILTFVIYALCFSAGRTVGIGLAGLVSLVWATAWLTTGAPAWTVVIPAGVFIVGSLISVTLYRVERVTAEQAELIRQLRAAQSELAASERSKGVLEERARVAAEIHDTLAQGFTSIVLLSRAAQRTGHWESSMTSVEQTAQENLEAARRLVEAIGPAELDSASLPDALDRQMTRSLPPEIRTHLQVVGRPRPLNGAIEVTLLRAAQEALLNVRTHAKAEHVHLTLSYLDDVVALDVRDDGVGFVPGRTNDRGNLTGGQGLKALEHRASSLSGELTIEAMEGGGSVVSVLLPASAP